LSFRFTERDLDLIQLEELHSDSGYADWFFGRIGLDGWKFESARHSVSAEVNASWGETDLLVFVQRERHRKALLIEDKIAAAFTDRQAHRYRERGHDLVARGECQSYITVLVAPSGHLQTVPEEDPWDFQISVEEIADWFSAGSGSHANWRARVLNTALDRVTRSVSPENEEVIKFSAALAAYLAKHHAPTISHRPGKDKIGPTFRFAGSSKEKLLQWKFATNQMTLLLDKAYVGLADKTTLPFGVDVERASEHRRKSDSLVVAVPPVDLAVPFDEQLETIEAAIEAALKLISFVPKLDKLAAGKSTS